MNLRVTNQTQSANAIANMRSQWAALAKYQNQISSGQRVNLPSDDPTAYPALARARAASGQLAAYSQNINDATSDLNAGVSALQNVNSVLTRARQIATEGADAGTDQQGQDALATEVDSLIQQALTAGNTQNNGRYLFGGTNTTTPPFQVAAANGNQPTTITYAGSDQRARALTGAGQTVDTRYVGSSVFQKAGADVFQTLIQLRDNLRDTSLSPSAKSQALNQGLADINAASKAVGDATAEQSADLAGLQAVQARASDLKLNADSRASDLSSTDYAEAAVQLQQQQTALQATFAVSANLLSPSLLDFIH